MEQPAQRSPWLPLTAGTAVSAGLHTTLMLVAGLSPQRADDVKLWSFWFVFASGLPVFVLVLVGALVAAHRRLRPWGVGLVVGAIASPALWLTAASLLDGATA